MRKNMERVIAAFEVGQAAVGDSKRSCWTDGQTVYSYQMPIGRRTDAGAMLIIRYEDAPTPTTRAQVRALQIAFGYAREVSAAELAPGYEFRDLAAERGWQAPKRRYGVARKGPKAAPRPSSAPRLRVVK